MTTDALETVHEQTDGLLEMIVVDRPTADTVTALNGCSAVFDLAWTKTV